MKIASIAAEINPLSKAGGLGDVAAALPEALVRLGQNVIIVTPFYKKIINTKKFPVEKIYANVKIRVDAKNTLSVSYYKTYLNPNLPIYLVSADAYFGRKKEVYGSSRENTRFLIFDVAVLKLLSLLKFSPDIIHCHDWPSGLIPELLKKNFRRSSSLAHTATVFTSHNLDYQFGTGWGSIPGKLRDTGRTPLPLLNDFTRVERINFTKRAILYADAINTVSETYRQEILQPKFGQDLHRILQNRQHKLFGVINGIDYDLFNPATDGSLSKKFDINHIDAKTHNKKALQKKLHFPQKKDPLIVMSSRIAEQKGWDIVLPVLPNLLSKDVQLVVLGDGDKHYIKRIKDLEKKHPETLRIVPFKEEGHLETFFYAGGDIMLLPSRFEPCGTVQLKAMRYGCVPVVREVGGLGETVSNFDPLANPDGNGFIFKSYSPIALTFTLSRALETYKHRAVWRGIVTRGMRASFSWDLPAKKYMKLYRLAKQFKKEQKNGNS